jgi:hypothetical protein
VGCYGGHLRSPRHDDMKNNSLPPLQPYELEFSAWFLEDAGADFRDRSDDETFLPATDRTLAVAATIRAMFGDDAPRPGISRVPGSAAGVVQLFTSQAMEFFSWRCRELAASTEAPVLDTAELAIMAQLLELAGESHENVADELCFDLTLDVTPENRSMFGAAVDHYLARRRARGDCDRQAALTAMAIRACLHGSASAPAVDMPDYWLMFFLAQRCRNLAAADI